MATAKTARSNDADRPETGETLDDQTVGLNEPTTEEIERRAYELYVARGEVDGHDQEDWLQAERELKEGRG